MSDRPYKDAARRLAARFGEAPRGAIVLGSGMGPVTGALDPVEGRAPYGEVGLPGTGVEGHAGEVLVGRLGGERVAMLAGRVHLYEGRPVEESLRAVRALRAWGVERVVLTSAVGCIDPALKPGMLVRITDHINLQGRNVLTGPNDPELGPRFPDLSHAYDPELGAHLDAAARALGMELPTAVYVATPGPSYETPAEIRMYGKLGAGVVGMSLAGECTGAVHAGLRVLAISTVSNYAAGLSREPLEHEDVTRVVGEAAHSMARLLTELLRRW